MDLTKQIYLLTESFPKHELYGLTGQLRRAAVSIPSNLAEGASRNSRKEFAHFISTARGSLAEVDTQIELALFVRYISNEDAVGIGERITEVGRLLTGLRKWSSQTASPGDQQPATSNKRIR
jgi:four helix bundle protein